MEPLTTVLTLFDDPAQDDHGTPAASVVEATPTPLLLTIRQAAQMLGLGRTTIYGLIGDDVLEVVHVGRSARIPLVAVEEFVDALRSGSSDRS